MKNNNYKFETNAIHSGLSHNDKAGAIIEPIYQTSTYIQKSPGEHLGFEYSRTQNPTRLALEKSIAILENAKFACCFASGCAAATAIVLNLKAGDHIICARDVYGGTYRLFQNVFKNFHIQCSFVDMSEMKNIDNLITNKTRLVWIETPTNPMLNIVDIKKICALAKNHNVFSVVDNTFATPYLQQPLNLGADLVVHSTSKYFSGHSDTIGGAIATNNEWWYKKLCFIANSTGNIPGPFDCFLILRGIKTLPLRMKKHCENASLIASYLQQHQKISCVYYPGLSSHKSYSLTKKQMLYPGGIISFTVKGGLEKAKEIASNTKLFCLAESLGSVESLIEHPAIMTHASIPKSEREQYGVLDNLLRISVGIEDANDLIQDLQQAIA